MGKLPLKAFQDLALNEIQHIVDVMREADVEENEELNNDSTIKRAPISTSQKSTKKESQQQQQQIVDENDIDKNNNTLKRTNEYENMTQNSDENNINQLKSDRIGIPSVPRVHMGAGFMKIFNQCPLEIHASYCWMNNETKGIWFSTDFTISLIFIFE
jgi:hypothetical protein